MCTEVRWYRVLVIFDGNDAFLTCVVA